MAVRARARARVYIYICVCVCVYQRTAATISIESPANIIEQIFLANRVWRDITIDSHYSPKGVFETGRS